jgi:hypothetical protein
MLYKIHFYMVLSLKTYILNNNHEWLTCNIQNMFANFERLSMDLNKLFVPGLIILAHFSLNMDLLVV